MAGHGGTSVEARQGGRADSLYSPDLSFADSSFHPLRIVVALQEEVPRQGSAASDGRSLLLHAEWGRLK